MSKIFTKENDIRYLQEYIKNTQRSTLIFLQRSSYVFTNFHWDIYNNLLRCFQRTSETLRKVSLDIHKDLLGYSQRSPKIGCNLWKPNVGSKMSVCFFRTLQWNQIRSEAERCSDDGGDISDGHEGAGEASNVTLVTDITEEMLESGKQTLFIRLDYSKNKSKNILK